jgi:ATPase subunit of ABC transporter with duplicated ATPase domains
LIGGLGFFFLKCVDWITDDMHKHYKQYKEKLAAKVGEKGAETPRLDAADVYASLKKVNFPKEMWKNTIGELSGGWRMKLLLANAMMKKADILLLDEPTNHLDVKAVNWLCDYLNGKTGNEEIDKDSAGMAVLVISHDAGFLNRVSTNVINYASQKLVYYEGNFDAFKEQLGLSADVAEDLLAGNVGVGGDTPTGSMRSGKGLTPRGGDDKSPAVSARDDGDATAEDKSTTAADTTAAPAESPAESPRNDSKDVPAAAPDRKAKIIFPIPGKVPGLTSLAKPVIEIKDLHYSYDEAKGEVLKGISGKVKTKP